jgi:hypothetical protein
MAGFKNNFLGFWYGVLCNIICINFFIYVSRSMMPQDKCFFYFVSVCLINNDIDFPIQKKHTHIWDREKEAKGMFFPRLEIFFQCKIMAFGYVVCLFVQLFVCQLRKALVVGCRFSDRIKATLW